MFTCTSLTIDDFWGGRGGGAIMQGKLTKLYSSLAPTFGISAPLPLGNPG